MAGNERTIFTCPSFERGVSAIFRSSSQPPSRTLNPRTDDGGYYRGRVDVRPRFGYAAFPPWCTHHVGELWADSIKRAVGVARGSSCSFVLSDRISSGVDARRASRSG